RALRPEFCASSADLVLDTWHAPPLSRRAVEHAQEYFLRLLAGGAPETREADIDRVRAALAALVRIDAGSVTFTASVADALEAAAAALEAPGYVVAVRGDAPHLVRPFMARGHVVI